MSLISGYLLIQTGINTITLCIERTLHHGINTTLDNPYDTTLATRFSTT